MIERFEKNLPVGDLYPRLELIRLSLEHPDKIDAKFTFMMSSRPCNGMYDWLDKYTGWNRYWFKTFPIGYETHLGYKFLVSIDGHGCAWLRVPWIMHSNSLLVK
jgi:hypothetical protein